MTDRVKPKVIAAGVLLAAVLVGGCADRAADGDPVSDYRDANPTPHAFEICYNHGCTERAKVNLTYDDWRDVVALFEPRPSEPTEERARIQYAVALLETKVGAATGTDRDIGGWLAGAILDYQLDCVDESVNTTTYLMLLQQQGLIHLHDFGAPVKRGYFLNGWPHRSAVIADRETGRRYAVDSSFGDNGEPPAIVPLEEWQDGWKPPGA